MKQPRYRALMLLLAALTLPSAAIAWQAWQLVEKQRQLDAKDADDLRKRATREIEVDLSAQLNGIKLQEIARDPASAEAHADPAVVLTGWVENGRLVYPWDIVPLDQRAQAFAAAMRAVDFAARVKAADDAEYAGKHPEQSEQIYRELIRSSSEVSQREIARVLLAGVLLRAGRLSERLAVLRETIELPSDVVDENGHTLAFAYAAPALLESGVEAELAVLSRAEREIDSLPALVRSAAQLEPVVAQLGRSQNARVRERAATIRHRMTERLAALERMRASRQAQQLGEDFTTLGVTADDWRPFPGDELWLVGLASAREGPPLVMAVRAGDIARRAGASRHEQVTLAVGGEAGELLGGALHGLRVLTSGRQRPTPAGPSLENLLVLSLTFVIAVAAICGRLLWRDTQREVRMAEMRSQFVSSVSHELKTPLTAIRIFAETLKLRRASPAAQTEYLETIVNESERLTRLLNNVLDFSRIERGKKTYDMQPATLHDAVEAAARAMRFPLREQGFEFHVASDAATIPPMLLDRDAIEQAVLNLLSNAMKYSGDSREINLRLLRQNQDALIQVTDRGVGIASADQKRIFEKFYRVQTEENRSIPGTGLGLALVAHIAHAHGGSVEVESAVGQGSTFSIRLPITTASQEEEQPCETSTTS